MYQRSVKFKSALSLEHQKAEILSSWIQLSMYSILLSLYLIELNSLNNSARTTIYILSTFVFFSGVRVIASYKNKLGKKALTLSAIIDVILVLVLIWFFHIETNSPAAVSLKIPTFSYLFIIIALRALRFEIRYIIICGMTATLGWALISYLAWQQDHFNLASNLNEYVISDKNFIEAEIYKCLALLFYTFILSFAILQARKFFAQAIKNAEQINQMSKFFSANVSKDMTGDNFISDNSSGHEINAVVLFIDLRGFTNWSLKANPGEVFQLLNEYHQNVVPILDAKKASIDKFMGDGVLSYFSATLGCPRPALSALEAAQEILIKIQTWNKEHVANGKPTFEVGFGINEGPIFLGVIGTTDRKEYTILGNTVNLAAKFEKLNKKFNSQIVVDNDTLDKAVQDGYTPLIKFTDSTDTELKKKISYAVLS